MSRLALDRSNRGIPTINGRVLPIPNLDTNKRLGSTDTEHQTMVQYLSPGLDTTVREIRQEVEWERLAGRLRPFVEGEPIGVLPRGVKVRPLTDKQVTKIRNARMEDRRTSMLKMRRNNDLVMDSILRGRR